MPEQKRYDTNLAMGLGLIDETKELLQIWSPGLSATALYQEVLSSGKLAGGSAYRLRNIVVRCFANRFLVQDGAPATRIKTLMPTLTASELRQLLFLYTCRANPILADFVRETYWRAYESGASRVTKNSAEEFVRRAIDDGKTPSRWAEGQIERMGRYLTGCCFDFGLLGNRTTGGRRINAFRIEPKIVTYLAHELHFTGLGDNALLMHQDWQLFGLAREDVLDELKMLSLKGHLIIQAAGDVVRISWKQPSMETLCDVLSQG
ncbi:BrxA family protein [Taklimakanibacter deserti]|uniref:BrxA family protein n=1 Tax=Taklimakanibacter deserti TaxID=2267839 RepID=UPI0034D651DF